MFHHVVLTLRADGATKIVPVLIYTGAAKYSLNSWYTSLYPGDDVVSWIGEDPYAFGKNPVWRADFEGMVNRKWSYVPKWPGFYTWASTVHPTKPIMLGEWGVAEDPSQPSSSRTSSTPAISQLRNCFPKIEAVASSTSPSRRWDIWRSTRASRR